MTPITNTTNDDGDDDPVYQQLFQGSGILPFCITPRRNLATDPTALSVAVVQLNSRTTPAIHQDQVTVVCNELGLPPVLYHHNNKDGMVETRHDHWPTVRGDTRELAAQALLERMLLQSPHSDSTIEEDTPAAATDDTKDDDDDDTADEEENNYDYYNDTSYLMVLLTRMGAISFRRAVQELPFPLQFQLEAFLHKNNDYSKRYLVVLLHILLPPVLEVYYQQQTNIATSAAVWADALRPALERVRSAVERGTALTFWDRHVAEAAVRAREQQHHHNRTPVYRCTSSWQPVHMDLMTNHTSCYRVYRLLQDDPVVRERLLRIECENPTAGTSQATLCGQTFSVVHVAENDIWLYDGDNCAELYARLASKSGMVVGDTDPLSFMRACLALAFARETTRVETTVPVDQIAMLPAHAGCCTTGVFGVEIGQAIQTALQLESIPGAVHMTLGGVSGMMVSSSSSDPTLGIRFGMGKFPTRLAAAPLEVALPVVRPHGLLLQQLLLVLAHHHHDSLLLELQTAAMARLAANVLEEEDPARGESLRRKTGADLLDYVENGVLKGGFKDADDGEMWSVAELGDLLTSMKNAKTKCQQFVGEGVLFVRGVPDEWGMLPEGHVFLPNVPAGGPVLIGSSPSLLMGDIRTVQAVDGSEYKEYERFCGDVMVVSTKGETPLAVDLCGDTIYCVITEPRLADLDIPKCHLPQATTLCRKRHDQNTATVVADWFIPGPGFPEDSTSNFEGIIGTNDGQRDLMSRVSTAWFFAADQDGLEHEDTRCMADLAYRIFQDDDSFVEEPTATESIDRIIAQYGPRYRQAPSIVGKLEGRWEGWIAKLAHQIENAEMEDDLQPTTANQVYQREEQPPASFDLSSRYMTSTPLEILMDVAFGWLLPGTSTEFPIDYSKLEASDLPKLVDLVALEFKTSLMHSIGNSGRNSGKEQPKPYDVVLSPSSGRGRGGGELLVCLPQQGGGLSFRNKTGATLTVIGKGFRNVFCLRPTMRTIEALQTRPTAGSLMRHVMQRTGLVGATEVPRDSGSDLDEAQQRVVSTVLSAEFTSGIFVVHGPPGSGKTRTIAEVLKAVRGNAIVVAHTNAAVANVVHTLLLSGAFRANEDLVVWGENCSESLHFLNPQQRQNKFRDLQTKYDSTTDDLERKNLLTEFASWLNYSRGDNPTLKELACLCQDPKYALARARLLFCTVNVSASPILRNIVGDRFSLLVVEEAGQCSEAELYIATTFPKVRRMVVIGDSMQLRRSLSSWKCEEAGLGRSFLENCLNHYPHKVHTLTLQYRMNDSIARFVSESVDSGQIRTARTVSKISGVYRPVRFVDMSGMTEESRIGTSWKNDYDVKFIKEMLCHDKELLTLAEQSQNVHVLVISPYDAQVHLAKKSLSRLKSNFNVEVGTIDSFQGREADVVIVSLTRTKSTQMCDKHRLRVAFTRARSSLVIIGDLKCYQSHPLKGTPLGNLAKYVENHPSILEKPKGDEWSRPNWASLNTLWRPALTSKFDKCLRDLSRFDRNIALNTLNAVATLEHSKLSELPTETNVPKWQRSALKGYRTIQIVWVPKSLERKQVQEGQDCCIGFIEAHFAGHPQDCLKFIQNTRQFPSSVCGITKDLTGIQQAEENAKDENAKFDLSWLLTNELQHAILEDIVTELPSSQFILDPEQQEIVNCPLPLLLESRSGTGKTNCLFCHALGFARATRGDSGNAKPICFVTVSERLAEELAKRYEQAETMNHRYTADNEGQQMDDRFRLIKFFSFRDVLKHLLSSLFVDSIKVGEIVSFRQFFLHNRTSHKRHKVDLTLVENEIGGAIMGSLTAATSGKPLSREQYLEEKRSNIPNNDDAGRSERRRVYDVYEEYHKFKTEGKLYDESDVILQLLGCIRGRQGQDQDLFQSLYLDEVQDFSFAAIFLMCTIAGKSSASWCAAGDVAQMITPGCAFSFDGMKQTLRAVKENIPLNKVKRLLKNYRTSKGVLEVANAVLAKLKGSFPHAIDHVPVEIAVKDLDLPVVLLDWTEIRKYEGRVKFGVNQAVVYTGSRDSEAASRAVVDWIGEHPFILSCLDSKGLEFDDVVVYPLESSRKAWNPTNNECLVLLRELYVAITRARQRVVIVTKGKVHREFFESLNCETLETVFPSAVLVEFDNDTSDEEWLRQGHEMFKEKKYELAAGCFKSASNFGWHSRARGCHLQQTGKSEEAKVSLRSAAAIFYESGAYKECLDTFTLIVSLPPWNAEDNDLLDRATDMEPNYLPRQSTLQFAILRGSWNMVKVADLCNPEMSLVFDSLRANPKLLEIVSSCSEIEQEEVGKCLPLVVGDIHAEQKRYLPAIRLYITGGDYQKASELSNAALSTLSTDDVAELTKSWSKSESGNSFVDGWKKTKIARVLRLFASPRVASEEDTRAVRDLGVDVVRRAVLDHKDCGIEELHKFSSDVFKEDIKSGLLEQFATDLSQSLKWYFARKDHDSALRFAVDLIEKWTNEELLSKVKYRKLLLEAIRLCLEEDDLKLAGVLSNKALSTVAAVEANEEGLRGVWVVFLHDSKVSTWLRRGNKSPNRIQLLLQLFRNPESVLKRLETRCRRDFGDRVVDKAARTRSPAQASAPAPAQAQRKSNTRKPRVVKTISLSNPPSIGTKVKLKGLKAAHLNGKVGEVTQILHNEGRIAISIEGDESISIKPQNLEAMSEVAAEGRASPGSEGRIPSGGSVSSESMPSLEARASNSHSNSDTTNSIRGCSSAHYELSSDEDSSRRPSNKNERGGHGGSSNIEDSDEGDDSSSLPDLTQQHGRQPYSGSSASSHDEDIPDLTAREQNMSSSSEDEDMPHLESRGLQDPDAASSSSDENAPWVGGVMPDSSSSSSSSSPSSSDSDMPGLEVRGGRGRGRSNRDRGRSNRGRGRKRR